jgi:hypothetical protein
LALQTTEGEEQENVKNTCKSHSPLKGRMQLCMTLALIYLRPVTVLEMTSETLASIRDQPALKLALIGDNMVFMFQSV